MDNTVLLYIGLSAILFALGGVGVLLRRSPLAILMCIEIMWNAANLAFLTFARKHAAVAHDGHVFAFLVITVAAAEVAIGLAIIVTIFRQRERVDVDEVHELHG